MGPISAGTVCLHLLFVAVNPLTDGEQSLPSPPRPPGKRNNVKTRLSSA